LACEQAGVAVTLPKPQTSGAKSAGRFGKPDFAYLAKDDVYRCPAGEKLAHHFTADEGGHKMRLYLRRRAAHARSRIGAQRPTSAASNDGNTNTSSKPRRRGSIKTRKPCVCAETVEHPFATLKMRTGATHFLMKTLPKVATEMALHVLAYNLTRVMNIVGIKPLLAAIRV
jgi:hypothetical protein